MLQSAHSPKRLPLVRSLSSNGPPVPKKKNHVVPLLTATDILLKPLSVSPSRKGESLQSPAAPSSPSSPSPPKKAPQVVRSESVRPPGGRRGSHVLGSIPVTLNSGLVGREGSIRGGSLGERGSIGRAGSAEKIGFVARAGSIARTGSLRGSFCDGSTSGVPVRASVVIPAEEKNYPSRFALKLSKFYHQNRRYFSCLKAPILDPRTNAKLTWDSLVMLIVLYSAIVIPIEVGFPDFEFGMGWGSVSIATDVLFCLDVVQNFFVGFYTSEEEPMVRDRKQIACKYLTSWFILDVLAIIPADYVINGINNDPEIRDKSVLSLKLTRMVRLVRITKLARLVKLRQFAMKMEDVLELDAVLTRMTRLTCQVLLVTHVLACFWHLVGYTEDTAEVTWITSTGLADQNANVCYLYSFYWVIATVVGVGYGDIHATNTDERMYSMVIGAGGFGLIIANITKTLEM
ncbi:Cyclic nucleotide-binding protein, partial [Globisporangium splendens]